MDKMARPRHLLPRRSSKIPRSAPDKDKLDYRVSCLLWVGCNILL